MYESQDSAEDSPLQTQCQVDDKTSSAEDMLFAADDGQRPMSAGSSEYLSPRKRPSSAVSSVPPLMHNKGRHLEKALALLKT